MTLSPTKRFPSTFSRLPWHFNKLNKSFNRDEEVWNLARTPQLELQRVSRCPREKSASRSAVGRKDNPEAKSEKIAGDLIMVQKLSRDDGSGAEHADTKKSKMSPLWKPSKELLDSCEMTKFLTEAQERFPDANIRDHDYESLWQWSVANPGDFWALLWEFLDIKHSSPYSAVVENFEDIEKAKFFPGAKLNFAENLLRYRDNKPAYIFVSDNSTEPVTITYKKLYHEVAVLAKKLRDIGVRPGDRVAAYIPNIPEAGIAMLATTAVGGVWSSCSPDFGHQGVLDRFSQIRPRILFAADGYFFKGKRVETMDKLAQIAADLPSVEHVVVFNYTLNPRYRVSFAGIVPKAVGYEEFVQKEREIVKEGEKIQFEQLPFSHPCVIMYSSGTTGLPKCIVQGCGILLNHLKELRLHTNVKKGDRVFYYTTTGWMMWNWLTSALGVGAAVVLFDGNPLHPDASVLWKYVEQLKINVFGTSARYLGAVLQSGLKPKEEFDLSSLRTICSTGSPATTSVFNFVYSQIKEDVQFASISGGTDLNGCFALGCPLKPVFDGELQCLGLGLHVAVFDEEAKEVVGQKGELVCLKPFPSMPICFWDDEGGSKYHSAYFDVFKNVWRHGDYAEKTSHHGLIIYGRSDATLNPGGVRIGTADLYRLLEEQMEEVKDSVVVGQDYALPDGTPDVRVLLFLQMADGVQLDKALEVKIKKAIRDECSPRHVPWKIFTVPDIPHTVSGKKVELAVRDIMNGRPVKNKSALRNPESLTHFEEIAAELR